MIEWLYSGQAKLTIPQCDDAMLLAKQCKLEQLKEESVQVQHHQVSVDGRRWLHYLRQRIRKGRNYNVTTEILALLANGEFILLTKL